MKNVHANWLIAINVNVNIVNHDYNPNWYESISYLKFRKKSLNFS